MDRDDETISVAALRVGHRWYDRPICVITRLNEFLARRGVTKPAGNGDAARDVGSFIDDFVIAVLMIIGNRGAIFGRRSLTVKRMILIAGWVVPIIVLALRRRSDGQHDLAGIDLDLIQHRVDEALCMSWIKRGAQQEEVIGRSQYDPVCDNSKPWTAGRLVGAKRAFKVKQIWSIRFHLDHEQRLRDRTLLDLAIDSKRRGCDLVKLKIGDIVSDGKMKPRAIVIQQKTGKLVQFEIMEPARSSALVWLE